MKLFLEFSTFLVLVGPFVTVNGDRLAASNGEGLWIATIDDDANCDEMTSKIETLISGYRRRLGHQKEGSDDPGVLEEMDGGYDCFVEFSSPDDALVDLVREMEGVVHVEPDEEVSLFEFWGRDRADQDDLPLDKKKYMPSYNGMGQCLYIIDTGILATHNDFTGRAVMGGDFINENPTKDNNGHGTHCASIAAGSKHGIAPMTDVIKGVKVLSAGGSGSWAGVIKGIQWAVNDASKMLKQTCVLSLSLGGGKNSAINKAVEDAAKKHIVVVAAGNSNMDACSSSPAGAGGNVITVGSTKRDDYRSSFSNYGKCVDIFGPGSDITGAYIGSNSATKVLSGTSMATPYIAGLALQTLQKNGGDLMAARQDLFASALSGKVKNVGMNSPNLLGRIIDYTGPPTPPTVMPTMPPTMPAPTLCKKNPKTDKYDICVEFAKSQFGMHPWMKTPMMHTVVKPSASTDELMCKPSTDDFKGKFVLVKRGSCLFMEKVRNCEKQGAMGVLIYNDKNDAIFPPAYYGKEKTKIPSCMISMKDGTKTIMDGNMMKWGVNVDGGMPPTMAPTMSPKPTMAPTPRPTRSPTMPLRCDNTTTKEECRKRQKCNWDGYVCYIRWKYQKKRRLLVDHDL